MQHRTALCAALLGGLLCPHLTAQNVTLLKRITRTGSPGYNDTWGYTSPTGRDFAFLGDQAGIVLVEATDPQNITQKAFWPAPRCLWRDFTNYKQYIYSVSECHRGIRVIDMSNPDAPKDLGYVATSTITRTHNISVDPDTGKLYLSGTNQGTAVFDAAANPADPRFVGTFSPGGVHDICVRRGKAYLAAGYAGSLRIVDVTAVPTVKTIANLVTPGRYCHNSWVTEDDKLLCVTDELANSPVVPHMTVWDISNPAQAVKVGDYQVGNFTVHNVFTIGRTAYISHYLDGFHMVDLADPTKPTMVARYDTSTRTTLWHGCWGVYPFSDNGLIYASDMENGLYVLSIDCGHMNRYEAGTPGSNGLVPRARFDGATPRVGAGKLVLDVENLRPNARFVLALSSGAAKTNLLGVQVNVDLGRAILVYLRADAQGRATVPAPIPNDARLANAKLYFQIFAEDSGKPSGFSASRGMRAGICK